ncbi:chromosome segregation protein SMC [Alteribacter natronophilus]|uniref:chromosome segregation protein SMC n=1 Tax=Alteribacter natronophilus TaxID=2583810 RepID=UPI00110F31F4|nr:chromosome segregation protein SMC [Alteribacter natronophilus]TMW73185.1 chromosome segregation protein SMC [Alteribacter natronophilus]
MFLKRLDLVGFKSFADRLSIDFVSGVTAVVGPNGSGKSNISDGIRWVLGEQSAKNLRGGKMEDIIFSGTDSRKPLNMAEITLTLNNENQHLAIDYSEVSVTRRVYRSGDSEYLINNQTCRLKDIIDLFMDSGLGRESFSIIGQGRIEEILSSKPEERRKIFEEAAGVLKYKTRKVKSEKKLADTQDNLNRVDDILHELHGQVEPLREQADIARDYLDKKAELKEVEVGLFVKEIEELHRRWTQEKENLALFEKKEAALQAETAGKEEAAEQFKQDIQEYDDSIQKLQEMLLSASEDLEKKEGRKQVWQERKKNFIRNREQFREEIVRLGQQSEELSEKLARKEAEGEQAREQLSQTRTDLERNRKKLEELSRNSEQEIEQLKADYIEFLNEAAALKNEKRYLEDQLSRQSFKEQRLETDNKGLIEKREQLSRQKGDSSRALEEIRRELDSAVSSFRGKQAQLETDENSYRQKESMLYEAYRHVEQLRSKKEILEDMQNDYAGFFQGVKEILKERDRTFEGIEGAVAELIDVKPDYQTAIETALGAAQQHVVVKDEVTGRKAIAWLKQKRLGRATFLPMSVIKPRSLSDSDRRALEGAPGFAGVAKDLVSYDHRYEGVAAQLLGNVIVAKGMKEATELAGLLRYRYRVVTLEGDVVNPGGAMTGGSSNRKKSQLLGRQQELERVSSKLDKLEQEAESIRQDLASRKEVLASIREQINKARADGEALREREHEEKDRLRECETAISSLNERLRIYDQEKDEYTRDRTEREQRFSELDEKIAEAEAQTGKLNEKIAKAQSAREEQAVSRETVQKIVTELQIQETKEKEQLHYIEETLSTVRESWKSVTDELNSKQQEYDQLRSEIDSQADDGNTLEEQIEKQRHEKERTIRLIARRKSERLNIQQDLDDTERELKEQKRIVQQMNHAVKETEIAANRTEVELDNRLSKLEGEYELTFEAARSGHAIDLSIEEARTKVKLIRMGIDELGTVNTGAIEEYDRIKERYDFLLGQKEDLESAKATLVQIIEEMDEEMIRRFSETFDQIQGHFRQVFVQLFGGGRADLVLTNENDLLTSGVDIVAQPPGKKLQNLGLLSGGERALTAIALLFAILKARPVPFCVLDEVEAALDDANVARFAQYLKEFSGETQFIVVTHRKGTMEEADVLYGVTMQESGVSRLVSVKLEETEALVGAN